MHFVDNKFILRGHCEVVARPIKVGIVDDGVARRRDHFARVRILMPNQGLCTIADHKLVFIANLRPGNFHRPVAIALADKRIGRGAPLVESTRCEYF